MKYTNKDLDIAINYCFAVVIKPFQEMFRANKAALQRLFVKFIGSIDNPNYLNFLDSKGNNYKSLSGFYKNAIPKSLQNIIGYQRFYCYVNIKTYIESSDILKKWFLSSCSDNPELNCFEKIMRIGTFSKDKIVFSKLKGPKVAKLFYDESKDKNNQISVRDFIEKLKELGVLLRSTSENNNDKDVVSDVQGLIDIIKSTDSSKEQIQESKKQLIAILNIIKIEKVVKLVA